MSRRIRWHAFVLMRVYNGYLDNNDGEREGCAELDCKKAVINREAAEREFFDRLEKAIASVKRNCETSRKGKIYLIINDDTPHTTGSYADYRIKLETVLNKYEFEIGKNCFMVPFAGRVNSAAATYRIRRYFVNKAKEVVPAGEMVFAVTLDQDDELKDRGVRRIGRHIDDNGVVLSRFIIKDDKQLDITDDAGAVHNRLSRFLAFCSEYRFYLWRRDRVDYMERFFEEKKYCEWPFWSKIQKGFRKGARRWHIRMDRHLPVRDIIYANTMGWTKSYSLAIMSRYLDDLDSFMANKVPSKHSKINLLPTESYLTMLFFFNHPAYEDFLDFYALLYADVQLSGTMWRTHRYIKRSDSITSTPSISAFRDHRTASLINLVDLTMEKGEKEGYLRKDYQYKLLRHFIVKVSQIENILKKYRNDYDGGDETLAKAEFAKSTHDGYFVNKLCRLVENENRGTQGDIELFAHAEMTRNRDTLDHFNLLLAKSDSIREYLIELKSGFSLRYAIKKACICEEALKNEKIPDPENIAERYDHKLTPKQLQFRKTNRFFLVIIAIVLSTFVYAFLHNWFNEEQAALIAGIFSIAVAILTFLMNERSKLRTLAMEEASQKKLYYSEFEDLIRHMEANMKILMQIRKEMDEKTMTKPSDIHFNNLKWPNTSCLFSDEMAKIIDKDKVDDFARLKVNLRNINNSALWLQRYAKDPGYSSAKMMEMIDWELTRYFGYYINFLYLKFNNFSFPTPHQLDVFLSDKAVRNKLTLLFMAENPVTSMAKVRDFVKRYNDDRREKRSVLSY